MIGATEVDVVDSMLNVAFVNVSPAILKRFANAGVPNVIRVPLNVSADPVANVVVLSAYAIPLVV
jgi:hypothetical protein